MGSAGKNKPTNDKKIFAFSCTGLAHLFADKSRERPIYRQLEVSIIQEMVLYTYILKLNSTRR